MKNSVGIFFIASILGVFVVFKTVITVMEKPTRIPNRLTDVSENSLAKSTKITANGTVVQSSSKRNITAHKHNGKTHSYKKYFLFRVRK